MNEPSEGGASDRQRSLDQYRKVVAGYDRHMWFARRARQEAVGRLLLRPGHTVVDVGCGTGLSFGLIEAQIGAGGRLIGIEPSPEMLAAARQRVAEHGWNNVALLEATAEDAELAERTEADAALFFYTHDVLRSQAALERVFSGLRAGARAAAAGGKWAPRWALPVNAFVRSQARRYVTTFDGFERPWTRLESFVPDLEVKTNPLFLGAEYVAWGTRL